MVNLLRLALLHNRQIMTRVLIEHGADISKITDTDMFCARMEGGPESLEILYEKQYQDERLHWQKVLDFLTGTHQHL